MVSILAVLLVAFVVCSIVVRAECALCAGEGEVLGFDCQVCGGDGKLDTYYGTFMSLAAPIIAIVLALITKEVYSSLFIGIVIGGLLSANYNNTDE